MPRLSLEPLPHRRGRAGLVLALLLGLAAAVAVGVWLRLRQEARQGGLPVVQDDQESQRLRELAAAYYAEDSRGKARETLQPLVSRPEPAARDLIAAAIVELSEARTDRARELLERARAQGDTSAELDYNLGRVAYYDFDFASAAQALRRALEKTPGDAPTQLFLAQVLEELASQGQAASGEVEAIYRDVVGRGAEVGLSWNFSAIYRLAQLCQREGREDEAAALFERFDQLKERGVSSPSVLQMEEGNLGRLLAPEPSGNRPSGPGALPRLEDAVQVLPALAGVLGVLACDLEEDCRMDLVAWGPRGLFVAQQGQGFRWEARALVDGAVEAALAFDLGNDGDLDLIHAQGGVVSLLEAFRGGPSGEDPSSGPVDWRPWNRTLPELPSAPRAMCALDYDHEGDLDLVLVGDFGARLWRNDGAGAPDAAGRFTDVTAEAGLPTDQALSWCLAEDLDCDQDVDLLLGGPQGAYLADNLRSGALADASARLVGLPALAERPLVADLDGDGRPDLWVADQLFRGAPAGPFEPGVISIHRPAPPPPGARQRTADLDLDGSLDVFWVDQDRVRGRLSVGLPMAAPFEFDPQASSQLLEVLFADLDGDLANDLVLLGADALELRRGEQQGSAVRLHYRGKKDNRQAIGAVIEVRAGPVYRRIFARGVPELVGWTARARSTTCAFCGPTG